MLSAKNNAGNWHGKGGWSRRKKGGKMQIKTAETHKVYVYNEAAKIAFDKVAGGYDSVWVNKFTETHLDTKTGKLISSAYWEIECAIKHKHNQQHQQQTPTPNENITTEAVAVS